MADFLTTLGLRLMMLVAVVLLWCGFAVFLTIACNPATWRWLRGRCDLSRCYCRKKVR